MKTFLLSIVLPFCLASGCRQPAEPDKPSASKPLVIGVSVMNMANEYIVSLNDAMTAEAKKAGVQLIVNDAQRSAERRLGHLWRVHSGTGEALKSEPVSLAVSSATRKLSRNGLGGDQAGAEFSSNTLFPSRRLDNNPTLYL